MTTPPLRLNRDQLASFLKDHRQIRAFENLFSIVEEVEASGLIGTLIERQDDQHSSIETDYIDLPMFAPHVQKERRIQWNDDDGTVDIGLYNGSVLQVGQEIVYYAKNASGGTISNGTPVMFSGTVGASGKLEFDKAVADGTFPSEYMMGVATQDIGNNEFGYITSFGLVRGWNTTGTPYGETWSDGDLLYFDPATAGTWTNVQPEAPNIHIPVAVVINAGPGGSGSIFVRMQVEESLGDLQDVQITDLANDDILTYNGDTERWENANQLRLRSGDLGEIAGDTVESLNLTYQSSNTDQLKFRIERQVDGTTWTSAAHYIYRQVDATPMGFIKFGDQSSDLITFGEATTEYMYLDGSGKLGIGKAPDTTLDILSGNAQITLTDSTTNAVFNLNNNLSGGGVILSVDDTAVGSSPTLQLKVSGTETMRVLPGSVGVNISAPPNMFSVGAIEASSADQLGTVGIKSDANDKALMLQEAVGTEQWEIGVNSDGNLNFYNSGSVTPAVSFIDDGSISFSGSLTVSGEIFANGGISLPDNEKATFGTSDDLQIYHDGNDSYVQDIGTGDLWLAGNQVRIANSDGSRTNLYSVDGGSVSIRYSGNEKLATTITGVDVTGDINVTGTSYTVNDSNIGITEIGSIYNNGGNGFVRGSVIISRDRDQITYDPNTNLWTHAGGGSTDWSMIYHSANRGLSFFSGPALASSTSYTDGDFIANYLAFRIDDGSTDVIFYNGSGSEGMRWDKSAGRLGINISAPPNTLSVGAIESSTSDQLGTVGIKSDVNDKALMIQENVGAEQWEIGVDADGDLNFYNSGSVTPSVSFQDDDSINFSGSLTIGGEIFANGGIALPDNQKATFGTSDDLQIYHDGSRSYVQDVGTGDLWLAGNEVRIANSDGSRTNLYSVDGGAVSIRYSGAEKIATSTTGVTVTGETLTTTLKAQDGSEYTQVLDYGIQINRSGGYIRPTSAFSGIGNLEFGHSGYLWNIINFASDNAISFTNGTNNRFQISTGGDSIFYDNLGSEGMRWDSSAQRLGIGTSSPATALDVVGTVTATAFSGSDSLGFYDYTTDARIQLGANFGGSSGVFGSRRLSDAGALRYGTYWAYDCYWDDTNQSWYANRTNLSNKTVIEQNYHQGAAFKFRYYGGDASSGWADSAWNDLVSISTSGNITVSGNIDAGGHIDVGDAYSLRWGNGNERITGSNTSNTLRFITSNTEHMRLDSSGRLGIDNSSPVHLLSVGAIEASGSDQLGNLGIKSDANDKAIMIQEASGTEQWELGVDVDGDLNFYNSGSATPSVQFLDGGGVDFSGTVTADGLNLAPTSVGQITLFNSTSGEGIISWYQTTGESIHNIFGLRGGAGFGFARGLKSSTSVSNQYQSSYSSSSNKGLLNVGANGVEIFADTASAVAVNTVFVPTKRALFANNGDISFYEDTGTTASLEWLAATTALKITGRETSRSSGTYAFDLDNSAHSSNLTAAGAMRVKGYWGDSFIVNGLGDVSFFDDSGSAKFFWDASAESLGINTTSPSAKLDVSGGDARINSYAIGRGSGGSSTNTVFGLEALDNNTSGTQNTAIGKEALRYNTTGPTNTAVGSEALKYNTTGSINTAVGAYALRYNTTGIYNTSFGYAALQNNNGNSNVAVGDRASNSNTSGDYNVSVGRYALNENTTGGYNVSIGAFSLRRSNANYNTAVGYNALAENTTGTQQTALGMYALSFTTSGTLNTATGMYAGYKNTTGGLNVFNGRGAGFENTTGSYNTLVGYNAGGSLTTGSNNTIIGAVAGTAGLANTIIIGAGTTERLRVDDTGALGINTSTPTSSSDGNGASRKLMVNGDIAVDAGDYIALDDSYRVHANLRFDSSAGDEAYFKIQGYYGFDFITRSSSKVVIKGDTGYVGINTTSPSTHLEVAGVIRSSNGSNYSEFKEWGVDINRATGYLRPTSAFNGTANLQIGDAGNLWNIVSIESDNSFQITDGTDKRFEVQAGADAIFYDNVGVEGMRWDSSAQRLGIGTSSPTEALDVGSGNIAIDNQKGFVNSGSWTRNATPYGYIDFGPANTIYAHIYTDRPSFYLNKGILINGSTVWNAGNDGSGSGLDADLLDGVHGASFLRGDIADTFTGSELSVLNTLQWKVSSSDNALQRADARDDATDYSRLHWFGRTSSGATSNFRHAWYDGSAYVYVDVSGGGIDFTGSASHMTIGGNTVWHAGNDGSGSGLDADTVDGLQASQFLRSDTSDTMNGNLTITNDLTAGESFFGATSYKVRINSSSSTGIVEFNSTNGLIRNTGSVLGLAASSTQIVDVRAAGMQPTTDNVSDLGASSKRWDNIYATNGTIQTSDGNEKQDVQELSEAELRVAQSIKGLIRKFRFKSAVAEKGDDARIHFGVIAQDVKAAFEAEGLDAGQYGCFCADVDEDGNERLGIRYDELLAFVIAAL